jgi:hypothetical protein
MREILSSHLFSYGGITALNVIVCGLLRTTTREDSPATKQLGYVIVTRGFPLLSLGGICLRDWMMNVNTLLGAPFQALGLFWLVVCIGSIPELTRLNYERQKVARELARFGSHNK